VAIEVDYRHWESRSAMSIVILSVSLGLMEHRERSGGAFQLGMGFVLNPHILVAQLWREVLRQQGACRVARGYGDELRVLDEVHVCLSDTGSHKHPRRGSRP